MRRPMVLFSLVFVVLVWIGTTVLPVFWVEDYLPKGQVYLYGQINEREYKLQGDERVLVLTINKAHLISEEILHSNAYQILNSTEKVLYLDNLIEKQVEVAYKLPGDVLVYMEQGAQVDSLKIGCSLLVRGTASNFKQATNHGEFDMKKYYQILGIAASVREAQVECLGNVYKPFRERLFSFREYCGMLFDVYLSNQDAAIMKSILLGMKGDLTEEIKDVYKRSGIIHILAISGLHISLIGGGVYKLLRKMCVPIPVAACGGMTIVCIFCCMSGMGVSTVRAMCMFLLQMIAHMVGRTYDLLTGVCIAAIFILIEQPLYIYHSGFLLSFGAVLSIAILLPIFPKKYKLLEGLGVSLSIFFGTLPIQLMIYYQITPLSNLLNLVIIPFMAFLMLAGMLYLAFGSVILRMAIPSGYVIHFILKWFEMASRMTLKIPGQTWIIGKPYWWQVIVYLFLVGISRVLWEILSSKEEQLKVKLEKTPERKSSEQNFVEAPGRMYAWMKRFVYILILIACFILLWRPNREMQLHMVDVGQGDCFYISDGHGTHIMIDGGSSSKKKVGIYQIEPCLKYYGASKLDCIFLSHLDEDHYNGVLELIERTDEGGVNIQRLCIPKVIQQIKGETYEELIALCDAHNVTVDTIQEGDVWNLGSLCLECIYPDGVYEGTKEDTNENSMVLLLHSGEKTSTSNIKEGRSKKEEISSRIYALFTGDLEGDGERMVTSMLQKKLGRTDTIPILKVAHHGSKNSTAEELLNVMQPKIALISAGKGNRYGHPHQETLSKLENKEVGIYRTDESGEITIRFHGDGVLMESYLENEK